MIVLDNITKCYRSRSGTHTVLDRVGKIELSSGGTLFLDEIESITLNMQLKLLRVLEEREVEIDLPDRAVVSVEQANARLQTSAADFRAPCGAGALGPPSASFGVEPPWSPMSRPPSGTKMSSSPSPFTSPTRTCANMMAAVTGPENSCAACSLNEPSGCAIHTMSAPGSPPGA